MLDTGFVDREEELERLSELLSEAESGNPKLAFICGESGIGKRSLIEEFLKEKRGMLVLRHDCTPTKRNISGTTARLRRGTSLTGYSLACSTTPGS
jgi:hypothetical protein